MYKRQLLDVLTQDRRWCSWSADALERCADACVLCVNPIIYGEISIRFKSMEELEEALPDHMFRRLPLPWEAAFLAGKCFVAYQRRGGVRRSPLPDFYIGAHAATRGMRLLTRDAARYRSYFPKLDILSPDSAPWMIF